MAEGHRLVLQEMEMSVALKAQVQEERAEPVPVEQQAVLVEQITEQQALELIQEAAAVEVTMLQQPTEAMADSRAQAVAGAHRSQAIKTEVMEQKDIWSLRLPTQ